MKYEHGISIVIPTYNSSSYIEKALESVVEFAKGYHYEVICVDDKSNDIEELKTIVSNFEFARVLVKHEKSNAAVSRNMGINQSQYRWIFLLDSDDTLMPDIASRRLEMHENESCGIVFGNYITISKGNSIVSSFKWNNESIRDFILLNGGDFRTSTISIDQESYKKTLFDPDSYKHQDWIFGIKCFDNNEEMIFDDLPSAIINVDNVSRMSSKINLSASRYLVDSYIFEQLHKNGFSRKNWKNVIAAGDSEARDFFFSLYKPTTPKDRLVFEVYKLASTPIFMSTSSFLIRFLRKLKWKIAFFS